MKAGEIILKSKNATRQSNTTADSSLQYGKLPPQAIDLEEAVLGALMLEKDALTSVIDILHPESFYKDSHKMIFQSIRDLFERSEPIDILTVTNELKRKGQLDVVGGPFFITQLTSRVASAANIEYHSRIILQKHIQRELIRISSETIRDAFEDTSDVFHLLDRAEKNLFDIAQGNIRRNFQEMKTMVSEAFKQIEVARQHETGISGVQSGFTDLDRITSGWQKSDLIIIAARPGMGKTAFVLSLTRNAAIKFKRPVAVFSLEMSSVQLVQRMISSETGIASDKLRKGNLSNHEWQTLVSMTGQLSEAPIYIDDTPALSIFDLRSKCRRLKQMHNVELIIIDYLQLMRADVDNKGGNREQEISAISRSLKAIAKELNVPIIALSQLSRAVETRGSSKRPQLSDLRESGAIEQDADMVLFIYRPEYYNLEFDEENNSTKGMAEIIISKHRNGALDTVKLKFIDTLAKFADLGDPLDLASPSGSVKDYQSNRMIVASRMNDMKDDAPF
ncbi:MAG: replicative DNA helicase [Bacteroidetes bacterium]|mgnify:CR=1 FL=1|nr:MAG: replicative DNA helicase [Bacteroidota bacterium]REK08119.1 MAG: replicative DNA helicase [Bacteroidota bacterium]REK32324.1 MAG: replicative DNA helicase [Bacteroidota bacterium]REK49558.1 MAG: replicative DNA helicase [Bacteroidota bacterium]